MTCPYCGDARQSTREGPDLWYCNTCGRTYTTKEAS